MLQHAWKIVFLMGGLALAALPLAAQRVSIDFSGGYLYNVPGDVVPFRGAITGTVGFRVHPKLLVSPAVSYVVASPAMSLAVGGQVDYCLLGCLADLEVGLMGRIMRSIIEDDMWPVSVGFVLTVTALRSGFVVTRDFAKPGVTSMEVFFGLELLSIPQLLKALSCDEEEEIC